MKKLLIALGALVALLAIAVLVVPPLIPTAAYKQMLLDRVSAATGRTVRIDGRFGLTILPQPSLFANRVALANMPGETPSDMMTVGKLSLRLALLPLLSGHLVVRSFVLDKPVINLVVDKNGRPNWRFAQRPTQPAAAAGVRSPGGTGAPGFLKALTLGEVRIVDGRVTCADARTGAREAVDSVNLTLSLPALDRPMVAAGTATWRKEAIALALRIADPEALLVSRPTAVRGDISAKLLRAGFEGTLKAAEPVTATGTLTIGAPSLNRLVAWLSDHSAPQPTADALQLHGEATLAGADIALKGAAFTLGAIKGNGNVRLDDTGVRPDIAAQLTLGKLDLDPYLPAASTPPAPTPASPAAPGPSAPPHATVAPPALAPLRRVDANLDLTFAGLTMRRWEAGPSQVALTLKDGRLTAKVDRIALYGGGGTATLTLDATAVPAMTLSCKLSGVQLEPLLVAAANTDRLEGAADVDLQVSADGDSQQEILSSLSGSGRLDVRNGALQGIDLVKLLRSAGDALNNPAAARLPAVTGGSEKTAFSQLSASYTIRHGVLSSNDLSLRGSLFAASGQGSINLADRTLDYRLQVKLYSPSKLRIGGVTLSELTVPIVATGPWDNPSYRPDLAAALRDVAKGRVVRELIQKIPGAKSDKGIGTILQDLPPAAPKAGGVLQQLFGR
jgi:AsmA protein